MVFGFVSWTTFSPSLVAARLIWVDQFFAIANEWGRL